MPAAVADPFADLRTALGALLPALPRASDALLLASAPRLADGRAALREWVALPRARFRWQCRTAADGSFSLFHGAGSHRERLNATIEVHLGAVEPGTVPSPQLAPHASLRRPAAWLPRPDGNLSLDLGGGGTIEVLGDAATDPARIAAVWTRGGVAQNLFPGREQDWPAPLWLALLRGLAPAAGSAAGPPVPLEGVFATDRPVWRTLNALLLEALKIEPALAAPRPALPAWLAELRMPWGLHALKARLGLLVDAAGGLATPGDEDTFLLPVNVTLVPADDGLRVELEAGLPDFAARGEVRDAVLAAFAQEADWDRLASRLGQATQEAVTADNLRAWLEDPATAFVVRTDRRDDSDEHLLVVSGRLGGREAAVILRSRRVVLGRADDGTLTAELRSGPDEVWVNFLEERRIGWAPEDGGKQLLCDLLHGLLRWHRVIGGGA